MHTSKLIQILRKQAGTDLKKLQTFANCSLYNTNANINSLFAYLIKSRTAPAFEHPTKLRKEHVFRQIFKGKAYNDHTMRKLLSDAVKIVETFICVKELTNNQLLQKKILIEHYEDTQLPNYFSDKIRQFEKDLAKTPLSSLEMLSFKHDLNIYKSSNLYTGVSRTQANHFDSLLNNLDAYYYATKLQFATNIMAQTFVVREVNPPDFIEPLLAKLKDAAFLEEPIIKLYFLALHFLMNKEAKESFITYQENLNRHYEVIPERLLTELYAYAFNYAILQILQGQEDYRPILFKLYKDAICQGALLQNGFIQAALYKNIATNALRLKEYQWLEDFLENYRIHLHPKEREDAYQYNRAKLHFEKKEYKKAYHILLTVEYADRFYQIDAKRLLCKIDYETSAPTLEAHLEALYMQMYREKDLTAKTVKSNKNFRSVLRRLISIPNSKKTDFKKLQEQIMQAEVIAERPWLLEKVKEKL